MGVLLDLKKQLHADSAPVFDVVSVSEVKAEMTVEAKLQAVCVSEYERPMFERAAKRYMDKAPFMLNHLLDSGSRPLSENEWEVVDKILWFVGEELHRKVLYAAERRYKKLVEDSTTPSQYRMMYRTLAIQEFRRRLDDHNIEMRNVIRALVAWACRHPELGLNDDLDKTLVVKDVIEYRAKMYGIPKWFEKAYQKVWRI